MLTINECIELEIIDINSQGNGVGRYNGLTIFVPYSTVGDKLLVEVVKVYKRYAIGSIIKIINQSEDRKVVDCPEFFLCGGCAYRHINYETELRYKEKRVYDALARIGSFINLELKKIIGSNISDYYRNNSQYPISVSINQKNNKNNVNIGLFEQSSHRIVDCSDCKLSPIIFSDIIKLFKEWLQSIDIRGYEKDYFRHLCIRTAEATGEIMVIIVIRGNKLPDIGTLIEQLIQNIPNLISVMLNTNYSNSSIVFGNEFKVLWGRDYLLDNLCDLNFKISPASFYQINSHQAERLYNISKEYANLTGSEVLLDLYCGTGTIGLTMANKVKKLIGIDIVKQAIENAKYNAKINNIDNAEFICGDVLEVLDQFEEKNINPDVVIIDPPRKGCNDELIKIIAKMNPERVVYVSCDPATLARDLNQFYFYGYQPLEITPVDLFPRTVHVECVVVISKVDK